MKHLSALGFLILATLLPIASSTITGSSGNYTPIPGYYYRYVYSSPVLTEEWSMVTVSSYMMYDSVTYSVEWYTRIDNKTSTSTDGPEPIVKPMYFNCTNRSFILNYSTIEIPEGVWVWTRLDGILSAYNMSFNDVLQLALTYLDEPCKLSQEDIDRVYGVFFLYHPFMYDISVLHYFKDYSISELKNMMQVVEYSKSEDDKAVYVNLTVILNDYRANKTITYRQYKAISKDTGILLEGYQTNHAGAEIEVHVWLADTNDPNLQWWISSRTQEATTTTQPVTDTSTPVTESETPSSTTSPSTQIGGGGTTTPMEPGAQSQPGQAGSNVVTIVVAVAIVVALAVTLYMLLGRRR